LKLVNEGHLAVVGGDPGEHQARPYYSPNQAAWRTVVFALASGDWMLARRKRKRKQEKLAKEARKAGRQNSLLQSIEI
jgi:hypothetical protein